LYGVFVSPHGGLGGPPSFLVCLSISVMVIEQWAVQAFAFRLLLLLVLRKQLLCAFLSLIFLCGLMPFVFGVLPMLEMQVAIDGVIKNQ
jgi:hypothetical protein